MKHRYATIILVYAGSALLEYLEQPLNTAAKDVTEEIGEIGTSLYFRRLTQTPEEAERDGQEALKMFEEAKGRPIRWGKP